MILPASTRSTDEHAYGDLDMATSRMTLLQDSAQRLFPDLGFDQVLAQLLLERAQRNLIQYRTAARHFEARYGVDFVTFRQQVLANPPAFEVEQDYFDWELAVTAGEDMENEIKRLQHVAP